MLFPHFLHPLRLVLHITCFLWSAIAVSCHNCDIFSCPKCKETEAWPWFHNPSVLANSWRAMSMHIPCTKHAGVGMLYQVIVQ